MMQLSVAQDLIVDGVPLRHVGTGLVLGAGPAPTGAHNLDHYLAEGGYAELPAPEQVRRAVRRSGLKGAGGAGYPMERKLAAVVARPEPRSVVANGEEGEPASVKDRWLLRHRPHLVIDGLRTAMRAAEADQGYVYTSDTASAEAARAAIADAARRGYVEAAAIEVFEVDHGYVAGEETSVVRALSGGEPKPTPKPPRPYERGVDGNATMVSNVESLARLALTIRPEVAEDSGSTVLVTIISDERAGLVEVPVGTPVREALALVRGADAPEPEALILGGFAGGIWRSDMLDAPLSHEGMRQRGALLGCGAIISVERGDCPIAAAADVVSFLGSSSSGQCGVCTVGSPAMARQIISIAHATADAKTLPMIERRADGLMGGGDCAMPDAIAVLVRTLLEQFPDEVAAHMREPCPICREQVSDKPSLTTRFRVQDTTENDAEQS